MDKNRIRSSGGNIGYDVSMGGDSKRKEKKKEDLRIRKKEWRIMIRENRIREGINYVRLKEDKYL